MTTYGERADGYAKARVKLRSSAKADAMRRLWEMAREALAARAALGVRELRYSTDLVPGVAEVSVRATERIVFLELSGITWGKDTGQQGPETERAHYVLDEAWLLGIGGPS